MWPEMPFDFIKLPEDHKGKHFGLFVDSELVSVVSLFNSGDNTIQFRKLATTTNVQGKGYGSELLGYILKFSKEQNMHSIWCNARYDKTDFYKKFDMFETDHTFTKQGLKFVVMKKVL